jgi:GDP-L-fucose synthase
MSDFIPHPIRPGGRIYVAGHRGLVGRALVRRLRSSGHERLVLRTRDELDLRDPYAVDRFFADERPEYVFLAAARVGGIHANATQPVEFLSVNVRISTNIIDAAWRNGTRRLLFLGSSCIYPRMAPQPLVEDALLSGPLEPTNAAYAVAKIAGVTHCNAYASQHGATFFTAMPTNLYGPWDNFDPEASHVLPGLLGRLRAAVRDDVDVVDVWGSGRPRREFLFVDDLADACVHLMQHHPGGGGMYNVGTGRDVTIAELATLIADVVGYRGQLRFDPTRPDGTPRKLLDVSRLDALGWQAKTELREGIERTVAWLDAYGDEANKPTAPQVLA